jgi:hypothetical protein
MRSRQRPGAENLGIWQSNSAFSWRAAARRGHDRTMTESASVSAVLSLGSIAVAYPSGASFDLATRARLATVECSSSSILVRAQDRTLVVSADLRDLKAHDTRTGELVWTQSTKWVSNLTVVHSNATPVLCMQGVKKWGGGTRVVRDAATGRALEQNELGPALASVDERRVIFGSAAEPAAFVSSDAETLFVHRAKDGAVVARFAIDAPPSDATTINEGGVRVTTFSIDFSGPRWSAFFGAGEVLIVTSAGLSIVDLEAATTRRVATDAIGGKRTVLDASRDSDGWWLLVREGAGDNARVDAVRLERDEARVRWSDCAAVALVGERVVNGALQMGAVADGKYTGSCVDAAEDPSTLAPIERVAQAIPMDPTVLASLARVRYLSKEKAAVGLSLAALSKVEAEMGRVLPNWALGLFAVNSSAVNKKLGMALDKLVEHNAELAAFERQMLETPKEAAWMRDPEPFTAGIVAIGRATRRERRSEPHWLRKIPCRFEVTTLWCAAGKRLVVVERWQREENSYLPATTSIQQLGYGAPTLPSLLAELVASLRPKHEKALRAAGVTEAAAREQEDSAVAALRELRLL